MSWNKNTVVLSDINSRVRTLTQTGIPYTLSILGEVRGNGLNDFDGTLYPIRKLTYNKVVVLEHMINTCDCDFDDYLESVEFSLGSEPSDGNWPLKIEECVCGNCSENINNDGDSLNEMGFLAEAN